MLGALYCAWDARRQGDKCVKASAGGASELKGANDTEPCWGLLRRGRYEPKEEEFLRLSIIDKLRFGFERC